MKTKKITFYGISLLSVMSCSLFGQEFAPAKIKNGFNNDVIANGTGIVSDVTSTGMDAAGWVLLSKNYKVAATNTPSAFGLPEDGLIKSTVNPAISFQLESYNSNNVLLLDNSNNTGNLDFASPTAAKNLYMLATMVGNSLAMNTPTTADVTIYFSDNSAQTISNVNIYDWYEGYLSDAAIYSIGRANRYDNNIAYNYTQPRLFQIPLAINSENQSKNIVKIQVKKTNTNGVLCIFAFTAELYNSCSGVNNLNFVQDGSNNSIIWDLPSNTPSNGYDYYISALPIEPTNYTNPSGHLSSNATSVNLSNLNTNQTYYFWIKSNCCNTNGIWKFKEFFVADNGPLKTNEDKGKIALLEVYPNPTDKVINFSGTQNLRDVSISDSTGRLIKKNNILNENKIDVSSLTAGVYYITANLINGDKKTFKIIKK